MKRCTPILLLCVVVAVACPFGRPIASAQSLPELAGLARSEKHSFRLATSENSERFEEAKAAIDRLGDYLDTLGHSEQTKLRQQLQWSQLVGQFEHPESDIGRLRNLAKRFYEPLSGLEADPMLEARSALDRYVAFRVLARTRVETLEHEYQLRLEQLAQALEHPAANHKALREHVSWLTVHDQAPRTLAGLRETFRHPNLVVTVSRTMLPALAKQFQREITRTIWSTNTILGRRVEGITEFEGEVKGRRPQGAQNAVLDLELTGGIRSPWNTAYAGAFRIFSQSETAIRATKRISWSDTKFISKAAKISANPQTRLVGGQVHRNRLLKNSPLADRVDDALVGLALRQARKSQDQVRREVACISRRTVREQFETAVNDRLNLLNREVEYYYTNPLVRVGMLPTSQMVVRDSDVNLQFHFHGLSGLAASSAPAETANGDIDVHIHESAFPNLIQPFAAGRVWTDDFFAHIQKEAVGDYSVELRIREQEERWSLTLDWLQPWSTTINREGVTFVVNARAFSLEGQHHACPLTVKSTFVPVPEVGASFGWQRVGEVELIAETPLDQRTRGLLHRKLSGFFLDRFFLDGLSAPAGGPWDQLSTVDLVDLHLSEAWLTLVFKQTQPTERLDAESVPTTGS